MPEPVARRLRLPPDAPRPAIVGYTAGVFDMFHAGHLSLLRRARERCDFLVVAVTTDELAQRVKGTAPVVPFTQRMAVLQHVRYVDDVVPQTSMDKLAAWSALHFDVLFVGDNVVGTGDWKAQEEDLMRVGARLVPLPASHTDSGELLTRGLDDLFPQ